MLSRLEFTRKLELQAPATFTEEETFPGRGAHRKVLGYSRRTHDGHHSVLVVYQDRVELVSAQESVVRVQYEREVQDSRFLFGGGQQPTEIQPWFIGCSFKKVWHKPMLLCVDSNLNIHVYDVE